MKQKAYSVAFPVVLVLVIVTFLSTIFFASVNLSFADSGKKKSQAVTRPSAVEHTEAQIKQLQGALNITAAQKELWDSLTSAMRENAKDMDAITKEKAEKSEPMNAVDHMKFHRRITQAHLDQLDNIIPPLEALYVSMSAEQQKTINAIFRTGKFGKHKKS
jgi:LTXXQ motif family protein